MDNAMRYSPRQAKVYLFMTSSIAAIGGFLFGYDTGIISGALYFIQQTYPSSTFIQELIVSSVVFGALIGALSSGKLVDRFGSQRMLFFMAITFILGTLISTCAINVVTLIIGRLIIGIAIGITSYLSPLFISEMAPANKRGGLVLLNCMMLTGGEAIAFLVDYALVPTQSWRLMFATGLIPATLLFFGTLMIPASPRWLVLNGFIDKARETLNLIRHPREVERELQEIISGATLAKSNWRELASKTLRPVLIIGFALGILQQFVGINTVMYYGPTIFQAAGFKSNNAQLLTTFGMGLMNTVMTLFALLTVDKIGRRRMLLGGLSLASISLGLVGLIFSYPEQDSWLIWVNFILMTLYIAGYSISLGSLFWLVIAEIYPLNIRGLAMSCVTALQWAANLLVTMTFLSLLNSIGAAYTFWIYGVMCIISFFFCYYFVPETRGLSLEHIENNLRQGKSFRNLGDPLPN